MRRGEAPICSSGRCGGELGTAAVFAAATAALAVASAAWTTDGARGAAVLGGSSLKEVSQVGGGGGYESSIRRSMWKHSLPESIDGVDRSSDGTVERE